MAVPIEATLDFSDSSKVWLGGIKDIDSYDPRNWIASGTYSPTTEEDDPGAGIFNPTCNIDLVGSDPDKVFGNILDGTVSLGQLARRNTCAFTPIGVPGSGGITLPSAFSSIQNLQMRSEERRVGKECRSRWSAYH